MKRTLAIVICFILLIGIFPTSVLASSQTGYYVELDSPEYFASGRSASALEQSVDMQALRTALFNAFYQCEPTVDISSFNIGNTPENVKALKDLIFYEMPDCFHIANYSRWSTGSKITRIAPTYTVSKAQYQQMYAQMVSVKDKLLRNIKDNDRLSDVEKALLIHDRLALHCEYDFTISDDNKHNCYGALVNASAVCQGYTEAYDYLLEAVGIKGQVCISEQLCHSWNIIYIDDVPYHVDVTWDDDAWGSSARGVVGAIGHDNFLRSSEGIYSTGHTANDFDTFPTDTTYDNYFWQRSKAAFQLIDNELYYIDNADASLKSYSDHRVLCSVSDTWKASSSSYWEDNYARLASNGTELYFSLSKAVYKFDLGQKTTTKIFTPSLSAYHSIYGFEYADGYLVCDINGAPPFSDNLSALYQIKERYNAPEPGGNEPADAVFADISKSSWQYPFANYACQKGLMAGKGTDAQGRIKFDPNNSITREEFAQVLYNAEDKPLVTIENPFPDVKNEWYKNAVLWANQAGIASGMGNGNFGVGKKITRQDLAMMLYKYAKLKGYSLEAEEGKIDQFADGSKVASYARTAMDWAVKYQILSGKGEAGKPLSTFKLDPAGTATRAECAAMLRNFMDAFVE